MRVVSNNSGKQNIMMKITIATTTRVKVSDVSICDTSTSLSRDNALADVPDNYLVVCGLYFVFFLLFLHIDKSKSDLFVMCVCVYLLLLECK